MSGSQIDGKGRISRWRQWQYRDDARSWSE
jgi:hypothetical protein